MDKVVKTWRYEKIPACLFPHQFIFGVILP